MQLMDELEAMSSRGFTEGFFRRHPPQEYQQYEQGTSMLGSEQLVGEVIDANDHWLTIDVKNRFGHGDALCIMSPAGNHHVRLAALESLKGERLEVAPGSGHVVRIPRPAALQDSRFCLVTRQL